MDALDILYLQLGTLFHRYPHAALTHGQHFGSAVTFLFSSHALVQAWHRCMDATRPFEYLLDREERLRCRRERERAYRVTKMAEQKEQKLRLQ